MDPIETLKRTCRVAAVRANAPSKLPAEVTPEVHSAITAIQHRARMALIERSMPYRRGYRILPITLQLPFLMALAPVRADFKAKLAEHPEPVHGVLTKLYDLDYEVENFPSGVFRQDADDRVGKLLEDRHAKAMREAAEYAVTGTLERFVGPLERFVDRMEASERQVQLIEAGQASDRRTGRFNLSTIEDITRLLEFLPQWNVLGDRRLTRLGNELEPLKEVLLREDAAKLLRKDRDARLRCIAVARLALAEIDPGYRAVLDDAA